MLKSIQKWLHNNFLTKYGFGWLYRDFFTCCNTFGRILYFYNNQIILLRVYRTIAPYVTYHFENLLRALRILFFSTHPLKIVKFTEMRKSNVLALIWMMWDTLMLNRNRFLQKNRENDYHFYKIYSWKLKLVTFQ